MFQAPERENSASREQADVEDLPNIKSPSRRSSTPINVFDHNPMFLSEKEISFNYAKAKFINILPLGKGAFSQVF